MNKELLYQPASCVGQNEKPGGSQTDSGRPRPDLDRHDSVREHLQQRLSREVAELEARIAVLRVGRAPHKAIIIATYERMIARKVGFMSSWNLQGSPSSHHH